MSWKGVKKQSYDQEIKSWCEEMGIQNYTINSKGEIDVDKDVWLENKDFKELPYKFGRVKGFFDVGNNPSLTSLKNCPNYVGGYFSCGFCPQLDSLKSCPKEVDGNFYCDECKQKFEIGEIQKNCNVRSYLIRNGYRHKI